MRNLDNIKRIIVKVGSSSLCDNNGKIEKEKILQLVLQISQLKAGLFSYSCLFWGYCFWNGRIEFK